MQNESYIYLIDNGFLFYNKRQKKLWNQSLANKIVEEGKILHRPKFLREFLLFLKKNKITKKWLGNVLYFISPPNFNEIDKEILKKTFDDLPFQKLEIIKESNLYQMKKNSAWINLNLDYAFITYLIKQKRETLILKNNYLNQNLENQIIKFLELNLKIKKIFLIGTNPEIPIISKSIEKKTNKVILYYEEPQNYIINRFL